MGEGDCGDDGDGDWAPARAGATNSAAASTGNVIFLICQTSRVSHSDEFGRRLQEQVSRRIVRRDDRGRSWGNRLRHKARVSWTSLHEPGIVCSSDQQPGFEVLHIESGSAELQMRLSVSIDR